MATGLRAEASIVAERIRAEMAPSSILLFGSVARGIETASSDLDFCLLFEVLPERKIEVMRRARSVCRRVYKGPIDIIAYSREEWNARIVAGSSFELNLQKEAIAL
ncbi:MAG: nucleotidyltransferase domain-containing protein [Treponema sp.]|nr:nucleotidyltransferase domain-containing protein [Treponema sp.]